MTSCPAPGLRLALERKRERGHIERVLGHSLGGLMATYNVSRHRKQKMAALVALEAEILRIVGEEPVGRRVVPLRRAG
jgi:hypothetical protein